MEHIECEIINDLPAIACRLLEKHNGERIFALRGNMGAGKTTFMQSVVAALGSKNTVSSPTFSIVNEYVLDNGEFVYHFDFYRIKNLKEAIDIGFDEYLYSGNYCFIEWAENVEDLLPEETVNIIISVSEDRQSRRFSF